MIFTNELIGGLLIGFGLALPLLWEGRIAGVSGYAAASLRPHTRESKSALFFILGLVVGGFSWSLARFPLPETVNLHTGIWALAGLLVGFGSRLAGGCTSGHGVCGLGRLSPRSFVSVILFMTAAILTRLAMSKFS